MPEQRTIHVVGTGAIGEPLIGFLLHLRQELALMGAKSPTFASPPPRRQFPLEQPGGDRLAAVARCG
jgi:hypothetical protein